MSHWIEERRKDDERHAERNRKGEDYDRVADELASLRAAVRALLDGVNKRYPNKHRNEWTCPHMAELDRLVPHDDGK